MAIEYAAMTLSEFQGVFRTRILRCLESFTSERFGLSDLVDLDLFSLDWRWPSVLRAYTQKTTRKDSRTREDMRYIMLQASAVWEGILALLRAGAGSLISSCESYGNLRFKSLSLGGFFLQCGFDVINCFTAFQVDLSGSRFPSLSVYIVSSLHRIVLERLPYLVFKRDAESMGASHN